MGQLTEENLSDLLRRYRSRAGLTQAALAAKAGLSDQAISVLERGTRTRPRLDTVRALIEVLRLDKAEADHFLAVARGKNPVADDQPADNSAATETLPLPWQLPPAVSDFTGRTAQIEAILDVLRVSADGGSGTSVRLVAITGMGGIGKTTLAVQAAHQLVDSYPDGHLYLNLRGYGPGHAISTADAVRQLLRSLGTEPRLVPDDVEEAAGLLRSQLAGRRVLLLLDNAADLHHVVPLLPGHPSSAAIVTSRGSLTNLPGALQVQLDGLSASESVELLGGVVGRARISAEPVAAEVLTSFAGRLPLAVRLIGGRLAARPNWTVQHLVDLLGEEDRKLDSLGSDDTGVRANIASSVEFLRTSDHALDREAAQALPLLSLPDGPDLLVGAAAAVLNGSPRLAGAVLERLTDLNLMESVAPERYRFHDLIRFYGRELAEDELTSSDRQAVLERLLRFYIGCAWQCQTLTHPGNPRLALALTPAQSLRALTERESALVWFDGEQRNLMDRFVQAAPLFGDSALLPELALAMFGYHEARWRWIEMEEMSHGAVEAATSLGLSRMAAWLQHDRAIPTVENGRLVAAVPDLTKALAMFEKADDLTGQARCSSSLTFVLSALGRTDEALRYGEHSLTLSQKIGDQLLEGVARMALGYLYNESGDYGHATTEFDRSIALAESNGQALAASKRRLNASVSQLSVGRYEAAMAYLGDEVFADESTSLERLLLLALAHAAQGGYAIAERHVDDGLSRARRVSSIRREGDFQFLRAELRAVQGDREGAIENAEAAATTLTPISPTRAELARKLGDQLRSGTPYSYGAIPYSYFTHLASPRQPKGGGSAE